MKIKMKFIRLCGMQKKQCRGKFITLNAIEKKKYLIQLKGCVLSHFNCVRLFATPQNVAHHSVHGIIPVRILEWVAMTSFLGSSQPSDQTHISCISCIHRWVLYHQCQLGSPNILKLIYREEEMLIKFKKECKR